MTVVVWFRKQILYSNYEQTRINSDEIFKNNTAKNESGNPEKIIIIIIIIIIASIKNTVRLFIQKAETLKLKYFLYTFIN